MFTGPLGWTHQMCQGHRYMSGLVVWGAVPGGGGSGGGAWLGPVI